MTAKETLDMFRARSQFTFSMSGLAVYFVVVLVFVLVMHRIPADQRLTIAVLLLASLPKLVDYGGAFWLSRSRDDGAEKPPTVSSSATPGGGTSVSIIPAGTPPVAPAPLPPEPSAPGAVVASTLEPGDSAVLSPTDGETK